MRFFKHLVLFISIFFSLSTFAEIIDNKKITNEDFDVWRVSCEEDEMLSRIKCRLFVEITEGTTFFVIPDGNNKILLISKDGYYDRSVFIKVDNNRLVESKSFSDLKYGIVDFSKSDVDVVYRQMQTGKFVYIRFYIKDRASIDGFKEITVKFSLDEFKDALEYYDKQINKYY